MPRTGRNVDPTYVTTVDWHEKLLAKSRSFHIVWKTRAENGDGSNIAQSVPSTESKELNNGNELLVPDLNLFANVIYLEKYLLVLNYLNLFSIETKHTFEIQFIQLIALTTRHTDYL